MLKIKIKYAPGVKPIRQAHKGEWFDLRAAETVSFKKGDTVIIPLGVAMVLPEGWEAKILPRSSTSRKHGLSFDDSGLIDNRYCGDNDWWSSTWVAKRDGVICQNTRICQFRLQREQPDVMFETVRRFNNEDRGGYGSTGEE